MREHPPLLWYSETPIPGAVARRDSANLHSAHNRRVSDTSSVRYRGALTAPGGGRRGRQDKNEPRPRQLAANRDRRGELRCCYY